MTIRFVISVFTLCASVGLSQAATVNGWTSSVQGDTDTKRIILKKAKAKLAEHFSSESHRFDIKPRWIPRKLLQSESHKIMSVELKGDVRRYTNFEVLYKDHNKKRRAQIQLVVKIEKEMPVVTRRLRSGDIIKEDDLKYQWVSLLQNKGELVETVEALKGKTLRRTLLSGQPVRRSYISRSFVVEAGDQVQVLIQKKGIQVQVTGEARENGAKGDKIRIYSKETRKKYEAEVIRSGLTLWKNTF